MAGEEGAAVDTSDSGGGDGGVETEGLSTEAANDNAATDAASTAPKYKFRRGGKELEHSAEEMAAMLDDDYEWNFHGIAGKPLLVDGKPLTRKWRDIVRDVQMGKGAADAARRANETRKEYEQRIAWGRAPENRMAFMRREMGIENPEQWALEYAAKAFERRQKMVQLAQTDPVSYERELRTEREQQDKEERAALERFEQQRQQAAQLADRQQRFEGMASESLKKNGVPWNARTKELVDQVCSDYAEAGAELAWEELANIVRDLYHDEIFGYLDPRSDEDLLKIFGDKRRERLRKAEIAAMKGAKKAAATPAPAAPKPSNGAGKDKGMTAEEFMRRGRNGGRV